MKDPKDEKDEPSDYTENKFRRVVEDGDIVRLKISITAEIIKKEKIFQINLKNNNLLEFHKASYYSHLMQNNFLKVLKIGFIFVHICGVFYFTYKIWKNYYQRKTERTRFIRI